MSYIILAAGKGESLYPLTSKNPKTSYKLSSDTTILQKIVRDIRKYDSNSEIVIVVGYMSDMVIAELSNENVIFIRNPFFDITNSIVSLWFARQYLDRENVTILHGDIIFEESVFEKIITEPTNHPFVLVDSAKGTANTYNVCVKNNKILVMSKKLDNYFAEYCGLTKLDAVSSRLLKSKIDSMIYSSMHNQYYEDSLVQMIMYDDFDLYYEDIKTLRWSHLNTVDDLLEAKNILSNSAEFQIK